MSVFRLPLHACRSFAIRFPVETLSAFDPLGILFGGQNRLHLTDHLFSLCRHRFTRLFGHFPALGPVLLHGLSLLQANRIDLLYLLVCERQVLFHSVGHPAGHLLRRDLLLFHTSFTMPLLGPHRTRRQRQHCHGDDQKFCFHINRY